MIKEKIVSATSQVEIEILTKKWEHCVRQIGSDKFENIDDLEMYEMTKDFFTYILKKWNNILRGNIIIQDNIEKKIIALYNKNKHIITMNIVDFIEEDVYDSIYIAFGLGSEDKSKRYNPTTSKSYIIKYIDNLVKYSLLKKLKGIDSYKTYNEVYQENINELRDLSIQDLLDKLKIYKKFLPTDEYKRIRDIINGRIKYTNRDISFMQKLFNQ